MPIPNLPAARPLRGIGPALVCLACFCDPASAQTRLAEIVRAARASDPIYAAAIAGASAGAEKVVQARAAELPNLALGASVRQMLEKYSTQASSKSYRTGSLALTGSQSLYRRGNLVGIEQAERQGELAVIQARLAEQDLLVRTSQAYFDVLAAQDVRESLRAQQVAFTQQLTQAKRSFDVGLVTITDVNEARTRSDLTAAQEIAATNDIEVKRQALERIVGRAVPSLAPLSDGPVQLLTDEAMRELAQRGADRSLAVEAARVAERVAELEVSRQDAAGGPTVDLVGSAGLTRNGSYAAMGSNTARQVGIGVDVALPLYQGGLVSSRVREATAMLERARQEREDATRQAMTQARQAVLAATSGAAMQRALTDAVQSGQTLLRSTQRGLEVGLRTRTDVLNAEQQLFATRRDLAQARYQTLVATLRLKAVVGELGDDDIQGIDRLLAVPTGR